MNYEGNVDFQCFIKHTYHFLQYDYFSFCLCPNETHTHEMVILAHKILYCFLSLYPIPHMQTYCEYTA